MTPDNDDPDQSLGENLDPGATPISEAEQLSGMFGERHLAISSRAIGMVADDTSHGHVLFVL